MSNNQTAEYNAKPVKKRRSLWWLWLILILVAFAGGIIMGLKLNTMPLPMQVKEKLYPVIESYIPGGTLPHTPTASPEATAAPVPTASPEATAAPVPTASPEVTAVPAPTASPKASPESAPVPEVFAASEVTPFPTSEPEASFEPLAAASSSTVTAPAGGESFPAAEASPAPKNTVEVMPAVSETYAFESNNPAASKYIGVDNALQIALDHAEHAKEDVEVDGVYRAKNNDGEAVYHVSFHIGEICYDYMLDAFSGEILSWKMTGLSASETLAFAADFHGNDQTEAEAAAAPEMISDEEARERAYAHAGVKAEDVLRSSVELDQTKEKACYHVVFRIIDRRFDYSVDACTGEILSVELR